jgi:hypothetical protein
MEWILFGLGFVILMKVASSIFWDEKKKRDERERTFDRY